MGTVLMIRRHMKKEAKTIGILAGMGPKSTGFFVDLVVSQSQYICKAKNDMDFPPMIIYSLPTPFYVNKPIDHDLMEKTICQGMKKLASTGVDFIAVPCNIAHIYFDALKSSVEIPLLNMVALTIKEIPSSAKNIAILATQPTMEAGIYQKGIEKAGKTYVEIAGFQDLVDALIDKVKEGSHIIQMDLWKKISAMLTSHHVDAALIACTDLSVMVDKTKNSFEIIDCSLSLAKEVVKKWKK
jgi:aspartate racemase